MKYIRLLSKNLTTYALINIKFFQNYSLQTNQAIIIKNTKIDSIVNIQDIPESIEKLDMKGLYISSGFIDLQLNGCGGVLFNDDISEKTLAIMNETNLLYGCTSFLPTLITTNEIEIKKAIDVVNRYYIKHPNIVLGIHIEGPYISKVKKGIHNPLYIKSLTAEMCDFLCSWVKKVPIKLTLAPEENNIEYIKKLSNAGIKISIGHTNATYNEAQQAIDAGACFATHLFNAMSAFEGREPSVVGAILNNPVYAGIIVDGYHVDYKSIEISKKIKKDKLFIVTDAVTPLGTNLTSFTFADQEIFVKNGKCVSSEGTLAGACIDMMSSVKNLVEHVGISLEESLKMASLYPAVAFGVSDRLGKIQSNYYANLAIFDKNYQVKYSISNGSLYEIKS